MFDRSMPQLSRCFALLALVHCGSIADEKPAATVDAGVDAPGATFSHYPRCEQADACNPTSSPRRCASIAAPYSGSLRAPGWCIDVCGHDMMRPCVIGDECVYFQGATNGVCLPSCATNACPDGMTCADSRGRRVCFPPPVN